jgi:hypothetical protein
MTGAVHIEPEAVYDDGSLYMVLGISPSTLARARREGRLKHTRKGKRVFYLGKWVAEWLAADPQGGAADE